MVEEILEVINNANLPLHRIPNKLIMTQIKDPISNMSLALEKSALPNNDFSKTQDTLQTFYSDNEWFFKNNQSFNKFLAEPLIGENRFSSPSTKNIDKLFNKCLGITDIVGRSIGMENKSDRGMIKHKLDELIEKRNDAAHTAGTVPISKQDIADYIKYSRRLTRKIDNIVGCEVYSITNTWPWRS